MATYNWQQKDWPKFTYTIDNVENTLFQFAEKVGKVTGILTALPESMQLQTMIDIMVSEAIKTSEIEGEYLSRKDVLSSIRNNLGIGSSPEFIQDKKAEGIGKLLIDVRNTFKEALSKEQLLAWHRMLLPDNSDIKVGQWRTHKGQMQVVSGAMGKQRVHFEAPPSERVPLEIEQFLNWFNDTAPGDQKDLKKAPTRAAIAHLYFETIHPFEDGNGRIGRAIAEKALAQGIGRPVMMSLSNTIEANKKAYYEAIEKAQRSNEITEWIQYFVETILTAQTDAEEQIDFTLKKVKFFDRFKDQLNERQLKVVKRMLQEGPNGFAGGINAGKYGSITKISKATATRDLQVLLELGAIIPFGEKGGRSTKYTINL